MAATAAADLSKLKAELEELQDDKNKNATNIGRKQLSVALQLVDLHVALDLSRGVIKFADVCIAIDDTCVLAHMAKCRTLKVM